ncbi:MAG TPA: universal stress protein [Nitrososphaeraceae archaeon]|jgi:nucleotide-binding universal stress UspA family protein
MTKTLHKILVCVDGSEKSLEAADYSISIAQNSHAQLVILNVIETEPWLYGEKAYAWGSPEKLDEAYGSKKVKIQKILDGIKINAEAVGVQSISKILLAPRTQGAVKAILEYVEQQQIDVLVVGTRGNTGIKKMLLGSVANGLVTLANCPVMVIK